MKIAILGYGTVGHGACEAIHSAADIEVRRILVHRTLPDTSGLYTLDFDDIVSDSSIELVAECIGGIHPALDYVMASMEHGKHVVTANKALVSAYYDELTHCAQEHGVMFRFTPSAGGGIPWLYNLQRSARCDTITEVHGIVNGTCNYILDAMHTDGTDFDQILRKAQELGYAESDPSADIDGFDTQRKCVLSACLAFRTRIREEDVPVLGIASVTADDIRYFNDHGYTCRLLMNAQASGDRIAAYVEPTLVTNDQLEVNVRQNFNMITLTAENVGVLSFYGAGAGKMPTGTSLVHDIIDIKDGIDFSAPDTGAAPEWVIDRSAVHHSYYFRIPVTASDVPESIIASEEIRGNNRYIITTAIGVDEAHALASSIPHAFAAGIRS